MELAYKLGTKVTQKLPLLQKDHPLPKPELLRNSDVTRQESYPTQLIIKKGTLSQKMIHPATTETSMKPGISRMDFLGIQNVAMALTSWDHINEDWRFPKM